MHYLKVLSSYYLYMSHTVSWPLVGQSGIICTTSDWTHTRKWLMENLKCSLFLKSLHRSKSWCKMSNSPPFYPRSSKSQAPAPQASLHTCEPCGSSCQQMAKSPVGQLPQAFVLEHKTEWMFFLFSESHLAAVCSLVWTDIGLCSLWPFGAN